MLSAGGVCPVCGEIECNEELMAQVPVGIATEPVNNGKRKSGRFFTTTERVWRNRRLVVGSGQTITWEEAVSLDLVEDEHPVQIVADAPHQIPSVERPDEFDEVPPVVDDEATIAVVRRRRKQPGGMRAS